MQDAGRLLEEPEPGRGFLVVPLVEPMVSVGRVGVAPNAGRGCRPFIQGEAADPFCHAGHNGFWDFADLVKLGRGQFHRQKLPHVLGLVQGDKVDLCLNLAFQRPQIGRCRATPNDLAPLGSGVDLAVGDRGCPAQFGHGVADNGEAGLAPPVF